MKNMIRRIFAMHPRDLDTMKRMGNPARTAALAGKPFLARIVKAGEKPEEKSDVGELMIYDAIGAGWFSEGVTAKGVAEALKQLKTDGAKTLNIFINSPGGDVFEATAIYNELARFDGKKCVFIDGLAASAASYIAMVGDEITTAFNAMWMIHNPWGMCVGNENDMRKTAEDLHKIGGTLRATYCKRSGLDEKECQAIMDAETWLTADEAKAKGFTDRVSGSGCSCEECGKDCPCGGDCGSSCNCPCNEDDEEQMSAAQTGLLARYKNTPSAMRPSGRDMVAAMQTRMSNLPKRASPPKRNPGTPGMK